MSIILKAENISKQYRLGTVGTGTLGDDLKRWWYGVRGKEDPFLKVGALNDRQSKASEDYVWALKDINFEVNQGEVLGIIGKNGAGKSTLLKLLSRVTAPTTGSIKTKGRIASLLEIGTGFHPELTGRENIFMNGAVLGMRRSEIKSKLDEIIAFSGCEKYIDTPVKRYSSGMTVRLGFAVAAHLEPEILVVDEVLAVGDAEFQKKAIGKMQDLSTGEGRTVLFVSHNMTSIQKLCDKLCVIENGNLSFLGDVTTGIREYLKKESFGLRAMADINDNNHIVNIKRVELLNKDRVTSIYAFDEEIFIKMYYSVKSLSKGFVFFVRVIDEEENIIFTSWDSDCRKDLRVENKNELYTIGCFLPTKFLKPGKYSVTIGCHIPFIESITLEESIVSFEITGVNFFKNYSRKGIVSPILNWKSPINADE
ncbi:lipopolysaccharide transport system ATP-binding protein [Gramella sp. Hel_I_59]|uniref:ABC transporter ATP-binding protein n=1 Tax=Gramella sp. Hel_I_59 TaxID=1249978 RepID=UPI001152C45D|nr:ABC transporter ATP-binding protein [Gramella sp. Hel_I_59]TQI71550.1 lipopolysaccharide transport system ATP-binding protein [Gramella sp. Hel_I_59]